MRNEAPRRGIGNARGCTIVTGPEVVASANTAARPGKTLNIALWIAQGLLAAAFGFAGFLKTTMPVADLAAKMVWPGAIPAALVRFIGVSEFLGAVGLILPAVTRIQPRLVPLAAAGLVTVMVLALGFHGMRGELALAAPTNLVLGGLAAFVAWGRFRRAPIAPRG
jgi:putative oxidoreductase